MPLPPRLGTFEVSLYKVNRIRIGNQWTDIQPGTLLIGHPDFIRRHWDGEVMSVSAFPDEVPLFYRFRDIKRNEHFGPLHHVQECSHPQDDGDTEESS